MGNNREPRVSLGHFPRPESLKLCSRMLLVSPSLHGLSGAFPVGAVGSSSADGWAVSLGSGQTTDPDMPRPASCWVLSVGMSPTLVSTLLELKTVTYSCLSRAPKTVPSTQ